MNRTMQIVIGTCLLVALCVGLYYSGIFSASAPGSPDDGTHGNDPSTVTLALGKTGTVDGITIKPTDVISDSRCATDVICIQAGTVHMHADVAGASQEFVIGEPVQLESESITLTAVSPAPVATKKIKNAEYRFTFKAVAQKITYVNASSDVLKVATPTVGAVTGKQFSVKGEARGNWFFEASFPVKVIGADGETLATPIAQAQGDWMTTSFVPFSASVTIPDTYTGPATLVLSKDNPSGLPQNDASMSFPILIEY